MINPVAFTINLLGFSKDIYWYGIIIAFGLFLGIIVAMYHTRLRGYKPEDILDFTILAVIFAVIGARLHYVIWEWDNYKNNLMDIFAIWKGGLAIYGALIGGCIALLIFSKWKKMRFLAIADIIVPSLILGQAIGRWGNFVNQEAYGPIINNPAFMFFPIAVFIRADGEYHMATFFYESIWNLMTFFILFFYIKKPRKEGNVFFLYLLLYGMARVVIEGLRTDYMEVFHTGIRINQVISAILIIFASAMLIFWKGGKIAEVHVARFIESKPREVKEKPQEPLKPVSDGLKLMSDDVRVKYKHHDEPKVEVPAQETKIEEESGEQIQKEESAAESEAETVQTDEDNKKIDNDSPFGD